MYKPTIWQDHVEGVQEGTDVNAKNLNNIEIGVMEAAALAALNAENSRHAAATANENKELFIYGIADLERRVYGGINRVESFYVIRVYLNSSERSKVVQLPEIFDERMWDYSVTPVIFNNLGEGSVGDIIVRDFTYTSFYIEYTGTSDSVIIDCNIREGVRLIV